jgi:1-acyl-sn-glycerol-3-phosphate acyltransferase
MRLSQIQEHLHRQASILHNALASLLITVPEAQPFSRFLSVQVEGLRAVVTVQELSTPGEQYVRPKIQPQDIALLQYTSGSTGQPKGVILTHANLLANIRAMGQVTHSTSRDVFVSWLPLYHDMGLIGAWLGSLYYGGPLMVMSPLTFLARPARWLWAIHRHRGTLSASPNFGYELCLRKIDDRDIEGLDLSSWRMAFNGAEPVSADTVLRFCARFAPYGFRPETMTPVYGLAESSVGLAFPPPRRGPLIDRIQREPFLHSGQALPATEDDPQALRFVACGQPLPGHEIRLVDAMGYEVAERQEGRLEFRGPSVTSGYFRNPEETRRLFHGEWLDSGDLAYIVGGDVYVTGRVKDIIIRAGRNIYPHELEEAISNIPGIRPGCVAVFGSPDPVSGTERLIVLAETRIKDPRELEQLRNQIDGVALDLVGMPPDEVVLAPSRLVLKTSSGKIRRAASRALYERGEARRHPWAVWWQWFRLALAGVIPHMRRTIQGVVEILYAAYFWTLLGLLAPPVWGTMALLPRISWSQSVFQSAARLFVWLSGTPVLVQGLENLPRYGPYVLVTNHTSYLDGLMLSTVLPKSLRYVAKRELVDQFIPRVFLQRIGTEFVERFDPQRGIEDTAHVLQAIQQGHSVVFFPEGTFGRVPGLLPFRMGAFVVAAQAGVPIVPLAICGTRSMLRADQWFPRRGTVRIIIGTPLWPSGSDWAAAIALRDAARAQILQHCGEPDLAPETEIRGSEREV